MTTAAVHEPQTLTELARFLTVAAARLDAGHGPSEMFSAYIDRAWHDLLEQERWEEFSTHHAGRVLVHRPVQGAGPISWISDYEHQFGPLPEIWFTDADGIVDQGTLEAYRTTGTVRAGWDCDAHDDLGDEGGD